MNRESSLLHVSTGRVSVAPSILASDFARLGEEIRRVEEAGADVIHVDVMDGHFVPNLTVGPAIVKAIRRVSDLPYDVHLMLEQPEKYVKPFAEAGADNITIHVEIDADVRSVLETIHQLGCSAGISLRPGTSASALAEYVRDVDLILVMTVEPGFGGQSFDTGMLPKIEAIRELVQRQARPAHIEVDGGINADTAKQCVDAGANLLVAGTSVFKAPNGPAEAIRALKCG